MPRNAKPIDILILDNKKHLTKDEIEQRRASEKSLHSGIIKYNPNEQVLNNPEALNMFKKLKNLYKGISYVGGLDENIINRYCLVYSETVSIDEVINQLNTFMDKSDDGLMKIEITNQIISATNVLHKLREMLLKLEDRLLLNPTARIKNVPKKQEKKEEPSENERRFGNV